MLKADYLANQEVLLEETRATPLFYFPGPIAFLVIIGILAIIFGVSVGGRSIGSVSLGTVGFYLFLLLFVIGLIWLAARYLRWISTVFAVTNRRVIVQRGILSRNLDEIPVQQVRGVDVHQSVWQRLLGYGSIRVSSEGGRSLGNEDWEGIPQPFRFQKIIENATVSRESQPQPVVVVNPANPTGATHS